MNLLRNDYFNLKTDLLHLDRKGHKPGTETTKKGSSHVCKFSGTQQSLMHAKNI